MLYVGRKPRPHETKYPIMKGDEAYFSYASHTRGHQKGSTRMTFDSMRAYDLLYPHFQKRVHRDEPLSQHSSFGVGGTADIWVTVEQRKELIDLVNFCANEHWPLLLVGDGSNIIFADSG